MSVAGAPGVADQMILCNLLWHESRPFRLRDMPAPQQGDVANLGRYRANPARIFAHELMHVMMPGSPCKFGWNSSKFRIAG